MAAALRQAASEAALANWGRAGRAEVERRFSLDSMVAAYQGVYDDVLRGRGLRPTH
jgi:glycosyltransferase involved in cell wall biosynthesis